jgi:hypothetical protein
MLLKTIRTNVRLFRCHYVCDDPLCSPVGSEWSDEALSPGASLCPCCDRETEPYEVEELCEERVVFETEPAL